MEDTLIALHSIKLILLLTMLYKFFTNQLDHEVFNFFNIIGMMILFTLAYGTRDELYDMYKRHWYDLPLKQKITYVFIVSALVFSFYFDYYHHKIITSGITQNNKLMLYTCIMIVITSLNIYSIYKNI